MEIVEDILWNFADFTWEGNEYIWNEAEIIINTDKYCYKWYTADFFWNENDYTWDDVCLVLSVVSPTGGGNPQEAFEKLPKEDKERFIKLMVTIKGETYTQTKKKGNKKQYKVTIKDINLVANKVLGTTIDVYLKN
jgi:hypothetical protein